jgi:hypothetical protein
MSPGTAAVLAALAVVVVVAIALAVQARWRRRAASRKAIVRARRARAGEDAALALLADAGYLVIDEQACLTWTVHCDGAPVAIELRCDAIVTRDGRRLVAEVKTGDHAPSLATAATRRQLLEYAVAYRADGVLLVDPEAGAIHEVDFDL